MFSQMVSLGNYNAAASIRIPRGFGNMSMFVFDLISVWEGP